MQFVVLAWVTVECTITLTYSSNCDTLGKWTKITQQCRYHVWMPNSDSSRDPATTTVHFYQVKPLFVRFFHVEAGWWPQLSLSGVKGPLLKLLKKAFIYPKSRFKPWSLTLNNRVTLSSLSFDHFHRICYFRALAVCFKTQWSMLKRYIFPSVLGRDQKLSSTFSHRQGSVCHFNSKVDDMPVQCTQLVWQRKERNAFAGLGFWTHLCLICTPNSNRAIVCHVCLNVLVTIKNETLGLSLCIT